MPRPRIPEDMKKKSFPVSLPVWLIRWLKNHGKPSALIESLILHYKEDLEKKDQKD